MDTLLETTLRDGTRVLIRMVEPQDKDRLVEGFARLSARSRYLRFHSGIEHLSDAQVRYLTEVDQVDHVAWVALDVDSEGAPGIGVARFVRVPDEPAVAEAAVTVIDEFQGRGLGMLLLGVLAVAAVRRGIRTFRGYVLGENQATLALFEEFGARRVALQPGFYRVEVDLPEVPAEVLSTAVGRIFRAVTDRRLPAMRTTAPPVWVADHRAGGEAGDHPTLRAWLDAVLDRRARGQARQGDSARRLIPGAGVRRPGRE